MRTTSYRSFSVLILAAIFIAAFSFVPLKAANLITSLDFQISSGAASAKIGDYLIFNMAVINSTNVYSNIVFVTVTANSIEVSSPDFPASFPGNIFVYDGVHTWLFDGTGYGNNYANPLIKSVVLTNVNLKAGTPLVTYMTLQYANFNAAEGAFSPGGLATVDIGTAISGIPLYDDGDIANHNDAVFGDGIYNGKFLVTEAYKFNIQNGSITGRIVNGGIQASNAPFTSPDKVQIDGVRPVLSLVNANPNPFNPNRELVQFYYYLSENSTVTLNITKGAVPVKTLQAAGNFGYNQPILWDGLSDSGVLQTDGDYTYTFNTVDSIGNTGVPFVGILKLTTVTLTTSLYSINTQYIHTSETEVEVSIQMHASLANATAINLSNLGFNDGNIHNYHNYPWLYMDLRLYDSNGNLTTPTIRDYATGVDTDPLYMNLANLVFNPPFADGIQLTGSVAYDPLPTDGCTVVAGHIYNDTDAITSNDWDNVFLNPFHDNGLGSFTVDPTFRYYSATMVPGTYIVAFKGVLVGKSIVQTNATLLSGSINCGVGAGAVPVTYYYNTWHAMPSYFYDTTVGMLGDARGYGLASDDNTVSFIVAPNPVVTLPDTTPAYIINSSEIPSDGKIVQPGEISPVNYIQVEIRDDGVGAGPVNLSKLVLKDPAGNPIPGHVAWNGGVAGTKTWSVYYIPDAPITIGGIYTYTITPADGANNVGVATTFSFTVADTAIPVVQNVSIYSNSGDALQLSSTTLQATFLVSRIDATINSGGTSPVDWTTSSISVSGVAGVLSHASGTNILEFTPSAPMDEGNYTVSVTAISANGYMGISTYKFFITTASVTYVDITGSGNGSSTCLRIAPKNISSTTQSGVTDAGANNVLPADLVNISVSIVAAPPAAPSGYSFFGNTIAFNISGGLPIPYTMGLNFDPNLCASNLRMHFTDAFLATLSSLNMTTGDLSLWVYQSAWSKVPTVATLVNNGSDHYFDLPILSIPAGNRYALMYQPPVVPPAAYKFNNDKAFNPYKGPAKVYYASDISTISSMKVYIYNVSGTIVRTLDFNDSSEHALFASHDTDPANPLNVQYYISWDGKNDRGSLVRNGIYIFKYTITPASGPVISKSRMIAVVK